eukprot:5930636-Prymnesium_polylepis.1
MQYGLATRLTRQFRPPRNDRPPTDARHCGMAGKFCGAWHTLPAEKDDEDDSVATEATVDGQPSTRKFIVKKKSDAGG